MTKLGFLISTLFAPLLSAQLLPVVASVQDAVLDPNGNIYVAGYLSGSSDDLSPTEGVIRSNCATCARGFLAKMPPSGDRLLWVTRLDGVSALAAAADGSIYAAGSAAPDVTLPPLSGYRETPASLYVLRLSSDGKHLLAGTWFGGNNQSAKPIVDAPFTDFISAMKLDSTGNVYVAGGAVSSDLPVTTMADHRNTPPAPGSDLCAGAAQFVAKFDSSLTTLLVSARIASNYTESASDLAVARDGTLFLSGTMGRERGPCQAWPTLTRLSADGKIAIYALVLEGRSPQGGYAVAADADGNAYIAGDNRKWGAPSVTPAGWLEKYDSAGARVTSATTGGYIDSLSVRADGELSVIGTARPAGISITPGAPGACRDVIDENLSLTPYAIRLKSSTLELVYAGYIPSSGVAAIAGPETLVVGRPYSTLQPYGAVPAGPPLPGTVTCVTSAANYDSRLVAPGEIISLFGDHIGPDQPTYLRLDSSGRVATEIGGISVTADGLPAPILYADPRQINVVMPFALQTPPTPQLGSVHIEVRRGGTLISSFDKALQATHPAAFTADSSGHGFLAALNQDLSINSPSNPAEPGEAICFFLTGMGVESPLPVDGDHPPTPATKPVTPVFAFVNQQPVAIEYIGNVPTLVNGLVQLNLRLPNPLPPSYGGQPGVAYIYLSVTPLSPGSYGGYLGSVAVR